MKADILNHQFCSAFTTEDSGNMPSQPPSDHARNFDWRKWFLQTTVQSQSQESSNTGQHSVPSPYGNCQGTSRPSLYPTVQHINNHRPDQSDLKTHYHLSLQERKQETSEQLQTYFTDLCLLQASRAHRAI